MIISTTVGVYDHMMIEGKAKIFKKINQHDLLIVEKKKNDMELLAIY